MYKEMKKFVNFLDTYKSTPNISNCEYLHMIHAINMNYLTNHIGKSPVYLPMQLSIDAQLSNNAYSEWQNMHEATIKPIEPPKEMKYIEATINTIQDVIHIIDTNPYDNLYEYNIDLKSLHAIRTELYEIHTMVGLESLKTSVLEQLLYFIQNLHVGKDCDFKHTVLCGPPGTGKTEIAKLMGVMYSKIGLLQNNTFQKVSRSDLIAGYLGQTAIKTQKVIEKSLGGVLFIDEAYSLAEPSQTDSFSKECIDTLCEALSNHKSDLMVIIAGYEDELNDTFFKVNRGLESRFIWRFKMEPYSPRELKTIFFKKVIDNEWTFENKDDITDKWFEKNKDSFKYYGRDMEVLFTYTKIAHGRRIYGKSSELRKKLSIQDIENGYQVFVKNKIKNQNKSFIHDMYV